MLLNAWEQPYPLGLAVGAMLLAWEISESLEHWNKGCNPGDPRYPVPWVGPWEAPWRWPESQAPLRFVLDPLV